MRHLWIWGAIVAAALTLAGCSADSYLGDDSQEIADKIGASECGQTEWALENRFTGASRAIYECVVDGNSMCVTYEGGVARDETDAARLAFEDTLATERPRCAA